MEDFTGMPVDQAGPSMPVAVTGWLEAPPVGADLRTAPAKKAAEEMAAESVVPPPPAFDIFRKAAVGIEERPTLNVIFKADVASSLEALERAVAVIPQDQVAFRVLDSGIGDVSEADVKTASAKGAVIFGFSVEADPAALKLAERDGIAIRTSDIIYEVVEAVRKDLERLLPSRTERTVTGKLRVLAIFKRETKSMILGGRVTSGVVKKGALVDVVKNGTSVRMGKITSLQQEKEDIAEAATGVECGLKVDTSAFTGDIAEGDMLEFVTEEQVRGSL
jgi:translation initiation factor IF-2